MKKLIVILFSALYILPLSAFETANADTIILLENRKIEIEDQDERMKVRVYEYFDDGDSIESEMIFEGHYRNGESYERRKYSKTITLPVPSQTWNRHFDPHWAGFGIGFNNFIDTDGKITDADGNLLSDEYPLSISKSLEYNLNFFEKAFPFFGRRFGLVTGLGMSWNRYHLNRNEHFMKVDGFTTSVPANEGIKYTKTRMGVNSFTVPLLLEWQAKRRRHSGFFISAGAVGKINYSSTSKVKYINSDGKKQKEKIESDLNVRLLTFDLIGQVGFGDFNGYVKYSPLELFKEDKGREVQTLSVGLFLNF